jgi:hypothetical protein
MKSRTTTFPDNKKPGDPNFCSECGTRKLLSYLEGVWLFRAFATAAASTARAG